MSPPVPRAHLDCALELAAGVEGEYALGFVVRNPGAVEVRLRYFRPFLDFDLSAEAPDGPVALVQPPLDLQAQPVAATVAPGTVHRIETPIRLRFDPAAPPSGDGVATRWTFRHEPTPLHLRAVVRLGGATVGPCERDWDPDLTP